MPSLFRNNFAHTKGSLNHTRDLPPVQLSNPAKEFVENRVQINDPRKLDEPKSETSTEEVDDAASPDEDQDVHCKQFAEVLQTFEDDLPKEYKTRLNLSGKHNWEGVIEEAKVAELKYKKKADKESPFGRVRGFFRSLQQKSPILDSWLGLLPSENEYASLICGGIKIILRAATRMDQIKEFMVKAMATIPEEVESAQLMIDLTQDLETSKRMYRRVSSLYYSVFGVLEHIINWYGQKSGARHFKAILQQGLYERKLEDKINDFKDAVSAVKNEAQLNGLRRLKDIYQGEVTTQKLVHRILDFLRSDPRLHQQTGQLLQPQYIQYIQPEAQRRKAISRQDLCDSVLRYDAAVPVVDLAAIMHRGSELSLEEQDRIVYVIESPILRTWLLSPKNGVLLVRENAENLDGTTSAMSFVAAHIIQSTQQAQKSRLLCVYWFAGQHRNAQRDTDADDVRAIMRSLIGQLLLAHRGRFDLYFVKRSTAVAIHDDNDDTSLRVLCDVFDELLFQLPEKTVVFCVLDRLAGLEYRRRDEVRYLLERLRAVARYAGGGKGSLFKLLLTHPGGAFRGATVFDGPGGEILDVPEDGDGNRMGFNKLMWDAKVSSKIDHLAAKPKR